MKTSSASREVYVARALEMLSNTCPFVLTVVSAAILISAEVFGAAFAGSWAIANLFALGTLAARLLDVLFVFCGIVVMVQFVRIAQRVEPFTAPN